MAASRSAERALTWQTIPRFAKPISDWPSDRLATLPFELAQAILNGLFQGGFFALAAVGLSLIYGVQKILNIAHGVLMVLAAFITIQFSILVTPRLHIDPLLSLPLDFIIMAFVGVVAYFALIYKTENKGFEGPLLATFGLSVFLEYIISSGLVIPFASHPLTLIPSIDPSYGNGAQAENQHYTGSSLFVGPLYIQEPQLIAFVIAIAIIPALQLFLSRTYYGNAIRATAQDWEAAEFSGINILRARLLAFSIGPAWRGWLGACTRSQTRLQPPKPIPRCSPSCWLSSFLEEWAAFSGLFSEV